MRLHSLLVGASLVALTVAQGIAQTPTPTPAPVAQGTDQSACLLAPTGACVADMALDAAVSEPEGWAITAAYEAFIQSDPNPQQREAWMSRYENWASTAKVEGVKDRIMPVRAEHKARMGDFDGAYKELGLEKANPETLGDPSTLILDEARAGHVKAALGRIDRLVEAESRDDIRLEILEIAQVKSPGDLDAVVGSIKDQYSRRLGQAFAAGVRGDIAAISPMIEEWTKSAKTGKPAPFDEAASAKAESWDSYLRGAMFAGNFDSFQAGLKKRGLFNAVGDGESAGRLLRVLIRDGRSDWIAALAPVIKLPKDEPLQVEEDLAPLKDMHADKMLAVVDASGTIEATNQVIADLAIEMLATRGDTAAALKMFIDKGRLAELNRVQYDQERVGITFETLWRALVGRNATEAMQSLKAQVTSQGAKEYMSKIELLMQRMQQIAAGQKGEEPSEDDWSIIVELAQASNDPVLMLKIANAIKEPGLRSSALVQVARILWEKNGK